MSFAAIAAPRGRLTAPNDPRMPVTWPWAEPWQRLLTASIPTITLSASLGVYRSTDARVLRYSNSASHLRSSWRGTWTP